MGGYSKKPERCAESLAKTLKKKFGKCWKKKNGKNVTEVGCWELDNNSVYGGSVIHEIANEHGGVREPFGSQRLKPSNFCVATHFAERAVGISRGED